MNKKDLLIQQIKNELRKFKHSVSSTVRFAEVDSFGVTHNVQYLYWIEWARVEYLKNLGVKLTPTTFLTEFPLMIVHTEIDYLSYTTFNDNYTILSRISKIKNSSVIFDNIILGEDNRVIARASATHLHLDARSKKSTDIPEFIINKIKDFEGNDLELLSE